MHAYVGETGLHFFSLLGGECSNHLSITAPEHLVPKTHFTLMSPKGQTPRSYLE